VSPGSGIQVNYCDQDWPPIRQVVGSRETALETALVLRQVISKARFQNINQLVEIIRSVGRKLIEAQPKGALATPPSMSLLPK